MALDYLDFSTPDDVKMPPLQKIKEEYPKELQSTVLFPEFTVKSTQNEGKHKHAHEWSALSLNVASLLISL